MPTRVVCCLDRSPARMHALAEAAAAEARRAGAPLHLLALVRPVDPTCGGKVRGADTVLERAAAEAVADELARLIAELGLEATSELVRGRDASALEARARAGDLLVRAAARGRTPALDYV